jgi:hypothetical protein
MILKAAIGYNPRGITDHPQYKWLVVCAVGEADQAETRKEKHEDIVSAHADGRSGFGLQ